MLALMSGLTGAVYLVIGWRFGFDRLPPWLGLPSIERLIAAVIFAALVTYLATLFDRRPKVKH